ncbi:phosphatase PAP2 family protein [Glutamicibacter sp.]|uniref:phosphatase PAP2 family protein n=1 Tax=Glutamicibacter sp. TaxID=1931995 RepID=UPI0028BE7E49|nr:phosphatase PAP2 family protein [Glutamicibacter sp.]
MRSTWYFGPDKPTGGKQVLWVVFGLIVAMFYFTRRVLVSLRIGGWATNLDQTVYQWVLAHQDPFWLMVAEVLYWWGSTPGMIVTMLIIGSLLCWLARSFWPLLTIAATAAGSVTLTIVLKASLQVPRPAGVPGGPAPPTSYSFPSGHTLNAAALMGIAAYLAVIYGLRRYAYLIGGLATLFVVGMGASRIYIGHHWLSDVVVGFLIGAAWAAVIAILHYFFAPRPLVEDGINPGHK